MDTRDAGRLGGNSTLQRYGADHFKRMGQLKKGKKSIGSGRRAKIDIVCPIDKDNTSGSINL